MNATTSRRNFLLTSIGASMAAGLASSACREETEMAHEAVVSDPAAPIFEISLAEWSLNPLIFGPLMEQIRANSDWIRFANVLQEDPEALLGGEMDHLDFAATARRFGIDGIEYVNTFFFSRAGDTAYLQEMQNRADSEGVRSLLIMCDALGDLGHPEEASRVRTVENHFPWVEAAAFLGCHSIRVNAASQGTYEEQQKLAADGLHRLCEFATGYGINVLVENHGGNSSNGQWLAGVMKLVDHPRAGTLPDFGNFVISPIGIEPVETYDRYQGVRELMPYAKSVSAKATRFGEDGKEVDTDFHRMMRIVLDAGYRGYVGIEYEGSGMTPLEGIEATKTLLEQVRNELASQYA